MNLKKYIVIFLLLLFLPIVNAVGIGGNDLNFEVNFVPNGEYTYTYYLITTSGQSQNYQPFVQGDLKNYSSFNPSILKDVSKGTIPFEVTFKLPSELEPGIHSQKICIAETESSGGSIGYKTTSCAVIKFISFYSGKYISASLNSPKGNLGDILTFKILVKNWGKENISSVSADIDLYEKSNKIGRISTNSISLNSGSNGEITADLDTSSYTPGEYTAIATINYDGNIKKINNTFKIGTLDINILNYTNQAYTNKINPFNINIESKWNSKINSIYSEVKVIKDGKELTSFKTPSESLDPWKTKTLKGYLDATNLDLGKYELNITVFYENKSKSQLGEVEIIKQPIKKQKLEISNTTIVISALIVIIIILVILFLKYAKKRY